jgi:hypothetical protein
LLRNANAFNPHVRFSLNLSIFCFPTAVNFTLSGAMDTHVCISGEVCFMFVLTQPTVNLDARHP